MPNPFYLGISNYVDNNKHLFVDQANIFGIAPMATCSILHPITNIRD